MSSCLRQGLGSFPSNERGARRGQLSPAARLSWALGQALFVKTGASADDASFNCAGNLLGISSSESRSYNSRSVLGRRSYPSSSTYSSGAAAANSRVDGRLMHTAGGSVKVPTPVAASMSDVRDFIAKCGTKCGKYSGEETLFLPNSLLQLHLPAAVECLMFDFLVSFVKTRRSTRPHSEDDPHFGLIVRPEPLDEDGDKVELYQWWISTHRAASTLEELAKKAEYKVQIFVDLTPHGNLPLKAIALNLVTDFEGSRDAMKKDSPLFMPLVSVRKMVWSDTTTSMMEHSAYVREFLDQCVGAVKTKAADGELERPSSAQPGSRSSLPPSKSGATGGASE